MNVQLHLGDCREVMATMPANSIDSICTDPPAGISFMSRKWDSDKGGRKQWIAWMTEVAAECLRLLKPGGHALVWALPRTSHWTATAWEDAGFEVRDCIYHIFGSGFPKSLAIDKAIDRMRDDEKPAREVGAWLRSKREGAGFSQKQIAVHWPSATGGLTGCVANWELGFNVPKWDQWLDLKRLIGFGDEMDAEIWRLNGRKGKPGDAWYDREVIGQTQYTNGGGNAYELRRGEKVTIDYDITAPATDEAKQFAGWGTALKPSVECWFLLRKPLSEPTVAQNVLRWGVGGLNIDASRIGTESTLRTCNGVGQSTSFDMAASGQHRVNGSAQGRWPANLILDDEAGALLDEMSGELVSGGGVKGKLLGENNATGVYAGGFKRGTKQDNLIGDRGGASRFFLRVAHDEDDVPSRMAYYPKASKRDRDEGLEGMPKQECGMMEDDNYPIKTGSGNLRQTSRANHHPTVKPTPLMQYLVRLVTPKGGTVLDPFMGSGSTGKAAKLEGFNFVGIELEAEYLEIARKRIDAARTDTHPQLPLLEAAG